MRIIGSIVALLGLSAVIIATSALLMENPLVPPDSAGEVDARAWLSRWRLWFAVGLVLGVATFCSGVGLCLRKYKAFLVLLVVAATLAMAPWIFDAAGLVRYAYEQPTVVESALFAAVAIGALVGYFQFRRTHVRT